MLRLPDPTAAVLFDLDGTLIDSEPLHWLTAQEVLAARGLAPDDVPEPAPGWGELEFWEGVRRDFGWRVSAATLAGERTERLVALVSTRPLAPRPGATELLATIDGRGLPRWIVSASPRPQVEALLAAVGLGAFAGIVSGHEDVPRSKPWPDPYLAAARRAGAAPAACVAIEDSATGLASAVAAGTFALVVPSQPIDAAARAGARGVFKSLARLVPLFRGGVSR